MSDSLKSHKSRLRKHFRNLRRQLSPSEQQAASQGIQQQLANRDFFTRHNTIASYLTNDGEPCLSLVHDTCWQHNIQVTVPVIHPFSRSHLIFLNYQKNSVMVNNKYQIPEPALSSQAIVPTRDLDAILVPLVAFDTNGRRLGMGGGYYDRTLASVIASPQRPTLIGVAHECQLCNELPYEHWDIPLDGIATPSRFIDMSSTVL